MNVNIIIDNETPHYGTTTTIATTKHQELKKKKSNC
jgi:hypothetical protein